MTLKKKTLKLASATGQNWQLANKKIIFEHQRYYDGFWVILAAESENDIRFFELA